MPKTPIDYSKSIIYKICCKDLEIKDIYIGSTTNFRKRKNCHKSSCNNNNLPEYKYNVYKFIRDNGNWENWDMVMIEEYKDCESKLQLRKKERYYIETLKCTLNVQIPTRTTKERSVDNKEQNKINNHIYYENNKERILEKFRIRGKQYRIDNYEKINKKHNCCCGGSYTYTNKLQHMRTNKHIKYLENNTE